MRRVKTVLPILKNCLVICERFKSPILCFELNAVSGMPSRNSMSSRRFSKWLETKATLLRSRGLVQKKRKEKYEGKMQVRKSETLSCNQRKRPSHSKNMINILYKQKAKSRRIKSIFERHMQLLAELRRAANSWRS